MCKEFNLVEAEDRNLPPSRKWITWNNTDNLIYSCLESDDSEFWLRVRKLLSKKNESNFIWTIIKDH